MLRDVVRPRRRRRRWAHAPVIHAASHFYYEKRVAWVYISMHACDSVPIVMRLPLAALRAFGPPELRYKLFCLPLKKKKEYNILSSYNFRSSSVEGA